MKNFFRPHNPFLQLSQLRRSLFFLLLFLSEEDLLEEAIDYMGHYSRTNTAQELAHLFPSVFQ